MFMAFRLTSKAAACLVRDALSGAALSGGHAVLLCTAGGAAQAAAPDTDAIQQAYDDARQEVTDPAQHVYELSFVGIRCNAMEDSDAYVCQVDYVRKSAPQGRLYFEVITIKQTWLGRWRLLSGLCQSAARAKSV